MKVLNFGSLNIDYVYQVDHFGGAGETLLSQSRSVFSGGKGLNQSVALGRAGVPVYHAGAVGVEGGFLIDLLKEAGVDVSLTKVLPDCSTGHAIIQKENGGNNCILLFGGANQAITQKQIDETLSQFEAGDYLILQNEISELGYLVDQAIEKGMILVLNPSPMSPKLLELPLKKIHYYLLNEVEGSQLTGYQGEDPMEMIPVLQETFPDSKIVLTLGEKGCVYIDQDTIIEQPALKVPVVDTTAAGDTFTGYFISGILEGKPMKEVLLQATCASSITIGKLGAAPSIPTREEVLEKMKQIQK